MNSDTTTCASSSCQASQFLLPGNVTQPATVTLVRNDGLQVEFDKRDACIGCQSQHCQLTDHHTVLFNLDCQDAPRKYQIGEHVQLSVDRLRDKTAVILGSVIPLCLVVLGFWICLAVTGQKVISGLAALSLLVPYYLALFLNRDILQKKNHIHIQ